jgi:hypothetical protein
MPHDTPAAIHAKREQEDKFNMKDQLVFTPDQAPQLAPPYKVYIFNLSPMEWTVEKGSAGRYMIKSCDPGESHSDPVVLPSVVMDSYFIESEMKTHSVSGEFMAQDIVHPTIGANWSFGQNLDDLGVFWTRNENPTEAEIGKARTRMEGTFRKLLTMATSIETSGRLDDITPLMRIAASYFGEDRPWNKIYKKLSECPGCGDPAKPGIIRHSCGYIFDLDRAMIAGYLTPEQYQTIQKARTGERRQEVERKGSGKGDRARTAR